MRIYFNLIRVLYICCGADKLLYVGYIYIYMYSVIYFEPINTFQLIGPIYKPIYAKYSY